MSDPVIHLVFGLEGLSRGGSYKWLVTDSVFEPVFDPQILEPFGLEGLSPGG
jgi:hypothetical protein